MGEVCPDDNKIGPDWAAGDDQVAKSLPERVNCRSRFQNGARSVTIAASLEAIWGISD